MLTGSSVENLLARHCAPTLAGIKPSNLFTLHFSDGRPEEREAAEAADWLFACGVRVEVLCECARYALVFVYREDLLAAAFTPEAVDFLAEYGYAKDLTLDGRITRLKSRLVGCGEFPHEIGIFLGYPVEDERGYIFHEGRNYKICGTWKEYGDGVCSFWFFVCFCCFMEYFCDMIERGVRIAQLAERLGCPA